MPGRWERRGAGLRSSSDVPGLTPPARRLPWGDLFRPMIRRSRAIIFHKKTVVDVPLAGVETGRKGGILIPEYFARYLRRVASGPARWRRQGAATIDSREPLIMRRIAFARSDVPNAHQVAGELQAAGSGNPGLCSGLFGEAP